MTDYFGFEKPKNGLEACFVEMSPSEFLQRTMPKATMSEIETYIDKNKARQYSEKMKEGELFPIPELIHYSNYTMHEGRHRAYAAIILGTKKIPVKIIDRKDTEILLWV